MNTIRILRKNKRMSQVGLANVLGVQQSTVAMWETGNNMPNANKLPKIAQVLGCTIDDLFSNEDDTTKTV